VGFHNGLPRRHHRVEPLLSSYPSLAGEQNRYDSTYTPATSTPINVRRLLILSAIALLLSAGGLDGQKDSSAFAKKLADYQVKLSLSLQLWSTYTTGMEVYDAPTDRFVPVDNRINTQFRRSRIGFKGQPYPGVSFNLTVAIDFVGKDVLAATEAGVNNGASPAPRLWNGTVSWQLKPGSENFYLMGGYYLVPIGRESMTAAFNVTSLEKAWSQNYLRRHLVGIGPGRAAGLNLGGLLATGNDAIHVSYDVSVQNPVVGSPGGNSTGRRWAPLLTTRWALHLGDPEFAKYSNSHKINYFGRRRGATLAFAASEQQATDQFAQNRALSTDLLFNWGPWNLDGEYSYLYREGDNGASSSGRTGYARLSHNISLPRGRTLEPVAMYWFFDGPVAAAEQAVARELNSFAGRDRALDLGANYYFNSGLKLSLHYTWNWAEAGDTEDPETLLNNYFQQSGLGAIRRGDWLGLGLVALL
jgi:hypothetical protein